MFQKVPVGSAPPCFITKCCASLMCFLYTYNQSSAVRFCATLLLISKLMSTSNTAPYWCGFQRRFFTFAYFSFPRSIPSDLPTLPNYASFLVSFSWRVYIKCCRANFIPNIKFAIHQTRIHKNSITVTKRIINGLKRKTAERSLNIYTSLAILTV